MFLSSSQSPQVLECLMWIVKSVYSRWQSPYSCFSLESKSELWVKYEYWLKITTSWDIVINWLTKYESDFSVQFVSQIRVTFFVTFYRQLYPINGLMVGWFISLHCLAGFTGFVWKIPLFQYNCNTVNYDASPKGLILILGNTWNILHCHDTLKYRSP